MTRSPRSTRPARPALPGLSSRAIASRHAGRPWISSCHRNSAAAMAATSSSGDGSPANPILDRPDGSGGHRDHTDPSSRDRRPITTAPERPYGDSETWRNAVAQASASAGRNTDRSSSPVRSTERPGPVDEVGDRHRPGLPVAPPDGAYSVQRRGERNHRPGRQGQAHVPADRRLVPDLERPEQRRAALPEQRLRPPLRHPQPGQLGQRARGRDLQPVRPNPAATASRRPGGQAAATAPAAARRTARYRRPARRRHPAIRPPWRPLSPLSPVRSTAWPPPPFAPLGPVSACAVMRQLAGCAPLLSDYG